MEDRASFAYVVHTECVPESMEHSLRALNLQSLAQFPHIARRNMPVERCTIHRGKDVRGMTVLEFNQEPSQVDAEWHLPVLAALAVQRHQQVVKVNVRPFQSECL